MVCVVTEKIENYHTTTTTTTRRKTNGYCCCYCFRSSRAVVATGHPKVFGIYSQETIQEYQVLKFCGSTVGKKGEKVPGFNKPMRGKINELYNSVENGTPHLTPNLTPKTMLKTRSRWMIPNCLLSLGLF